MCSHPRCRSHPEAPPATWGVPCSVQPLLWGVLGGERAGATPGLAEGSLLVAPAAGAAPRGRARTRARRRLLPPGQPGATASSQPPRPGVSVCPSTPGFCERCCPCRWKAEPSSRASREPERHRQCVAGVPSVPRPKRDALGTSSFRPPRSRRLLTPSGTPCDTFRSALRVSDTLGRILLMMH